MVTKIAMGEQVSDEGRKKKHENIPAGHVEGSTAEEKNLEILVKNVLMSGDEEHKYQEKVVVDVAMDQSVNRSRTTEDDSERVAYQVKIQEKV